MPGSVPAQQILCHDLVERKYLGSVGLRSADVIGPGKGRQRRRTVMCLASTRAVVVGA